MNTQKSQPQAPNPSATYSHTRLRLQRATDGQVNGILRQGELSWEGDDNFPHMFLNLGGIWLLDPVDYFGWRELPALGNLLLAGLIFGLAWEREQNPWAAFRQPDLKYPGAFAILGARGLEFSGNDLDFSFSFNVKRSGGGFVYEQKIHERRVMSSDIDQDLTKRHYLATANPFANLVRLISAGVIEVSGKLNSSPLEPRIFSADELGSALRPLEGDPYSLQLGDVTIFDVHLRLSPSLMPDELKDALDARNQPRRHPKLVSIPVASKIARGKIPAIKAAMQEMGWGSAKPDGYTDGQAVRELQAHMTSVGTTITFTEKTFRKACGKA